MPSRKAQSREAGPGDSSAGPCYDCGKTNHRVKANSCIVERQRQKISYQDRLITNLRLEIERKDSLIKAAGEKYDREQARASEYLKMATNAQKELARTTGRLIDSQKENAILKREREGGQ
ncbi:hypothetical protein N7540_011675 [Penicillium herquei]|nr:hypothetical protein N7540_011675 [Penicillium herquei]